MFSENNRISGRQAFRLLTYDLLGLSTLLVPTVLGKTAERDGIFAIAIGVAAAFIYLKLLKTLMPQNGGTFPQYLEQKLGKAGGMLVQAGYLLYLILLAGYTAYLFADVVLKELLREESFYLVLIVLWLLVAYGLWGGIEGRARIYEMLFWFLMIPLAVMLFFALHQVQTDYWTPVFTTDLTGIAAGSYYVFVCLSFVFLVCFLGEYVAKKEVLFRAASGALLLVGGIHAVLYLILLGIFGAKALGGMDYPAVTLMSTIQISGGFMKRTDAFMFAIWFFTLYALLNSLVFYGGKIFAHLIDGRCQKITDQGKGRASAVVVLLAVAAVSCCFYRSTACFHWYEWFLWHIGTPFVIAVPLVLAIGKGGKRALGLAVLVILPCMGLAGCGTPELEDRDFPLEIAVKNTEDFGEAWYEAEYAGNRMVDYSHLKVMVISRDFLENGTAMQELLALLEKRTEVPRNTYIVAADDPEEILKLKDTLGESVGSYLEEQFENVSQIRKEAYPTLGMFYQEEENRMETLFIPYIDIEEEKPVVERYFVWKRGCPAGTVADGTAMLAFFTENRIEEYQLSLDDGGVVSLFSPHNEVTFREEGDKREIVVNIRCSGRYLGRQEMDLADAEREIAAYMNRQAQSVLTKQYIDLSGGYKKLGGIRRDWYREYEAQDERFETDMNIVYIVDIDWVNL